MNNETQKSQMIFCDVLSVFAAYLQNTSMEEPG